MTENEENKGTQVGLSRPDWPGYEKEIWLEIRLDAPGVQLWVRPEGRASTLSGLVLTGDRIDADVLSAVGEAISKVLSPNARELPFSTPPLPGGKDWTSVRRRDGADRDEWLAAFADLFTREYTSKARGALTKACDVAHVNRATGRRWLAEIRANDELAQRLPADLRGSTREES